MSEVKVNKISPRTNCGTVQLGDSGDTITIPAGVSITNSGTASGFGATGAVSWDTTVKTTTFTATAGEGYFVNTTGGVVTVNLPAGTAGAVVGIKDYAGTFDTNAVTVSPNGSDKIGGVADDATLETEGIAVTFVFVDSTQGWLVTDSGLQTELPTPQFITATGGTITTSGNFKIHTFTGPGTFTVSCAGNSSGSSTVDYMVVAGGGGGGGAKENRGAGGGGAGGWRASSGAASGCYTAGPGPLTSPVSALPVTATGYPITVGAGGSKSCGPPNQASQGGQSVFSSVTSAGGGGGQNSYCNPSFGGSAGSGGSGGGGGAGGTVAAGKGSGNTPPVSPPQGFDGGPTCSPGQTGPGRGGHGGGGAGGLGQDSQGPPSQGAKGGVGVTSCITTSPVGYAGGGGAGSGNPDCGGAGGGAPSPTAPAFGGGRGGGGPGSASPSQREGYDATTNTGGGGGGASGPTPGASNAGGGNGGSGIVVIRYKFQ